jgi:hypothetical protein
VRRRVDGEPVAALQGARRARRPMRLRASLAWRGEAPLCGFEVSNGPLPHAGRIGELSLRYCPLEP